LFFFGGLRWCLLEEVRGRAAMIAFLYQELHRILELRTSYNASILQRRRIADLSDDEDLGAEKVKVEWALVGKVLSPQTLQS
jgi:hypothetical protein